MNIEIEFDDASGVWTVYFNGEAESDFREFVSACHYAADRLNQMQEGDAVK